MSARTLSRTLLVAALLGCDGGDDDDGTADTPPGFDTDRPAFVHDPLSMPEAPTHDLASFESAETCAECHPNHYAQWSTSSHAYAMLDPVFREMTALRAHAYDGEQDQFCTQCHTSIGTRGGDIVANYRFEDLQPITLEGVTCESCHKVSAVERPHSSGHVLDPDGPLRATIADPVENVFHASEHSPLHGTSEFCSGCHDVLELDGLNLERPYEEWLESPAAEAGTTCQDCHMPEYEGQAADGAPTRTLHSHRWRGVAQPLLEGFVDEATADEIRADVKDLLDGAASLHLSAPTAVDPGDRFDLVVTVFNEIDAHNLPTGSTFNRQFWLEVTVADADGTVLYATGDLDDNGDLRNYWSALDPYGDQDLIVFSSGFVDPFGELTLLSWEAAELAHASLNPLHERTVTLFVPTAEAVEGPLTVTARVRFRQYGPYLLRFLGLDQYVDALEIHDLAEQTLTVDLAVGDTADTADSADTADRALP